MKTVISLALLVFVLNAGGCINVKTHSTFDPIYMNLDVNLKVELQEELSSIFGDIDAASQTIVD